MMRLEESPHASSFAGPRPSAENNLDRAIALARDYLLSIQHEDGHWCGRLEGNTILESEYLLLMRFLGRTEGRELVRAAEHLRRVQGPAGGWSIYPDGPAEISTSIKAYFALKLAGDPPDSGHMAAARRVILDLGGLPAANTFTKLYLALLGQWPWSRCPAIPPELVLLPAGAPFSIHQMSSWSRAMVVPLSILSALRPVRAVPAWASLAELDLAHPARPPTAVDPWHLFFGGVDQILKLLERSPVKPARSTALLRAEQWILDHMEGSDGVGAIFPPIVNSLFALSALGYSLEHPAMARQLHALEGLAIDEGDTRQIQPCHGPVWDTSLALRALLEVPEMTSAPAVVRAAEWLLKKEVRRPGDWSARLPHTPPGGWYFQYENELYPDTDDTAEVLTDIVLLGRAQPASWHHARGARGRALRWLFAMQNEDGGWAAFDRGCTREILTHVPFADHNAMLDPSCPDITGRVLEAICSTGLTRSHTGVRRGVAYLEGAQERDGSWCGRWGVNHIYGTFLALRGLQHAGEPMRSERYQRARVWILTRQERSGGWGESPASYDDPESRGRGPVTATQTAWALLGLFAVGDYESSAVKRGVRYLLSTQEGSGTWVDRHWTGTGFPKVFYLHYHLYASYFPLLALAAYGRRGGSA